MADTHINTFIKDVEDAFEQLLAAAHDYHEKVETLKGRYASHVASIAEATGQSVPEVEALVPAASASQPEADQAGTSDQAADTGSTDTANTDKAKSSNKS